MTAVLDTADDGEEMAVIKRGQDGLMEEGLSLRNDITTTCRRFTRSMTMARQKEISLCSNNDASDDEMQQDHLEARVNDEIVHNNESDKEQRECPAEEVTDQTDDTDNGISWNYSEERDNNEDENMSCDYCEERDDNEDGDDPDNNNQVTLPTNAVALHRKALPPFANLLSANLPPKIPTDYVADPAIPRTTLWPTNHTTTRTMSI